MRLFTMLLLTLLLAAPAAALDGISLSEPVADTPADQCPALTAIKYPWLKCATNAYGGTTITTATVPAVARWSTDRRIPRGYIEVEGVGHWGDHIDGDGID